MPIDIDKVCSLLEQALAELRPPAVVLPPPAPPLATQAEFDVAYAAASNGDVLTLANSLVYNAPLTLDKSVTLISESYANAAGTRMTIDAPAPSFKVGINVTGDNVRLAGIDVRHTNVLVNIMNVSGANTLMQRLRVMGDAVGGSHRGIYYNGSYGVIVDSYVDDIFQPAQDTQAIYSQEMGPGGLLIDNCYLSAAGQAVMLGGGDAPSVERIPRGVRLLNSTLTKKPEWLTYVSATKHAQQVKCALELKCVDGFYSNNCVFEYAGVSMGQGAYLMVMTPRNQSNTAPFTTVRNVVIENFTGGHASGLATLLGSDNVNPSGPLANVVIRHGHVTNIDHNVLPGSTGRLITFDRGPQDVTFDDILIEGINVKAAGYFSGLLPPARLTLTRMTVPPSTYGWKLDGGTHPVGVTWPTNQRDALFAYMPDLTIDASI